jgi:hypothetical protein
MRRDSPDGDGYGRPELTDLPPLSLYPRKRAAPVDVGRKGPGREWMGPGHVEGPPALAYWEIEAGGIPKGPRDASVLMITAFEAACCV